MFSGLTARLQAELDTIKGVLETHDRLRDLLYSGDNSPLPSPLPPQGVNEAQGSGSYPEQPQASQGVTNTTDTPAQGENRIQAYQSTGTNPPSTSQLPVPWTKLKEHQPNKKAWQIYDHCAALTRLYALYEEFVIDLVSEFLRILPNLYPTYHELPERVRTQHRVGTGHILLKLSKEGPYRKLTEASIFQVFSHGFSGQPGFSLLEDAFFIDPQNYRSDIIIKIFSYLGFDDCWSWVTQHPDVMEFMEKERDEGETPEKTLSDFIEYRNEAAHSSVENIVATSDLISIANFIAVLCKALAELVAKQVVRRQIELGHLEYIGTVLHSFSGGVVGAKMKAVTLTTGDAVTILSKRTCCASTIESIRTKNIHHTQIHLKDGQELGLKLSHYGKKGTDLYRPRTLATHQVSDTSSASSSHPEPEQPQMNQVVTDTTGNTVASFKAPEIST